MPAHPWSNSVACHDRVRLGDVLLELGVLLEERAGLDPERRFFRSIVEVHPLGPSVRSCI
jgi:hypothetical protein